MPDEYRRFVAAKKTCAATVVHPEILPSFPVDYAL